MSALLPPNVNGLIPFEPGPDFLSCARSSVSKLSPRCSRCSRIFRANVKNASSMLIFCLQDTSKKGMSKFSAICVEEDFFLNVVSLLEKMSFIPYRLCLCLPFVGSANIHICCRPIFLPHPVMHSGEMENFEILLFKLRCGIC